MNDPPPLSSAVYCIGVFSLMMLSLLETVLVMYLIEKDSAPRDEQKQSKVFNKLFHLCKGNKVFYHYFYVYDLNLTWKLESLCYFNCVLTMFCL